MQLYIPKDLEDKAKAIAGDQKVSDVLLDCLRKWLGVNVYESVTQTVEHEAVGEFPIWGSIPSKRFDA